MDVKELGYRLKPHYYGFEICDSAYKARECDKCFDDLIKTVAVMILEARITTAKNMQRLRWELEPAKKENFYIADLESQKQSLLTQ